MVSKQIAVHVCSTYTPIEYMEALGGTQSEILTEMFCSPDLKENNTAMGGLREGIPIMGCLREGISSRQKSRFSLGLQHSCGVRVL